MFILSILGRFLLSFAVGGCIYLLLGILDRYDSEAYYYRDQNGPSEALIVSMAQADAARASQFERCLPSMDWPIDVPIEARDEFKVSEVGSLVVALETLGLVSHDVKYDTHPRLVTRNRSARIRYELTSAAYASGFASLPRGKSTPSLCLGRLGFGGIDRYYVKGPDSQLRPSENPVVETWRKNGVEYASVDYELIPDRSLEDSLAHIQATNFVKNPIGDRARAFNIVARESGYKAVWETLEMKKSVNGVWVLDNRPS